MIESEAYMARPQLPPPRPTGHEGPHDYELMPMKNPAYGPVIPATTHRRPQNGSYENEEDPYENMGVDEDAYEIIPGEVL